MGTALLIISIQTQYAFKILALVPVELKKQTFSYLQFHKRYTSISHTCRFNKKLIQKIQQLTLNIKKLHYCL